MKYYYYHHHHSRRIYSLDKERRAPLNHNTSDKRRPSKVKRKTNNRRTSCSLLPSKSGSFHSAGSRRKMNKILVVETLANKTKKKQVAPSFPFCKIYTSVLIFCPQMLYTFSLLWIATKKMRIYIANLGDDVQKFTTAKKGNRFSFLVIQCG